MHHSEFNLQNLSHNHVLNTIMNIMAKTNPINKIFMSQIIKREYEDILTGGFENMIYIGEIQNSVKSVPITIRV